jgi:hypothetical protein
MAAYQTGCLYCNEEAGFQFPWLHAIGIGVFVIGALLYHSNPNSSTSDREHRRLRRRPELTQASFSQTESLFVSFPAKAGTQKQQSALLLLDPCFRRGRRLG